MATQMILEICASMDAMLDVPALLCWPYEVLARTAVEAGGVVDWLMQPAITPRQRVVRYELLQWAGTAAQERTLEEMGMAADAALGSGSEAAIYSLYSLVAHAQLSGLMRGYRIGTLAGETFAGATPDPRATWSAVLIACRSLIQATSRRADSYGWEIDDLQDWVDEFDTASTLLPTRLT